MVIKRFLNLQDHQNPMSGSKGTTILQKGWILPIGGVELRRVCTCSLRSRLVSKCLNYQITQYMSKLHEYEFLSYFKRKNNDLSSVRMLLYELSNICLLLFSINYFVLIDNS